MISIITPTYNRAYILPMLHGSLCRQTSKDFEWIIIDDGSTDDTEDLVEQWHDMEFPLTYILQANGGKHRALNTGMKAVRGDYCMIVDSDDYLTDDAIEAIHGWIKHIARDGNFAGVSVLKGYIGGGRIGGYPRAKRYAEYVDATNIQRRKHKLLGDKAEVYRTDILKRYPFTEHEGENYVSLSDVWDAIAADGYKIRWFNKIIYKAEYLDDGLTRDNQKALRNFNGYEHSVKQTVTLHGFPDKQYAAYYYWRTALKKRIGFREVANRLNISLFFLTSSCMLGIASGLCRLPKRFLKYCINHIFR